MREEYTKMCNKQQYDINWFYKYFQSQGGNLDGQTFGVMFHQFGNLNDVIAFLDGKFNLTSLYQGDKFLKIVE